MEAQTLVKSEIRGYRHPEVCAIEVVCDIIDAIPAAKEAPAKRTFMHAVARRPSSEPGLEDANRCPQRIVSSFVGVVANLLRG